jgi:hypothetical protein
MLRPILQGGRRRQRSYRRRNNSLLKITAIVALILYAFFVWNATPDQLRLPAPVVNQRHPTSTELQLFEFSEDICDQHDLGQTLLNDWKFIDRTLSKMYSKARVSGGIFLYPRQAALLTAIVDKMAVLLDRPLRVCETGFGAGHSLALFLQASTSTSTPYPVEVYSFDKFDRPYQLALWKEFNKTHPKNKMEYFAGDSCATVTRHLSPNRTKATNTNANTNTNTIPCDVLHGSSLCGTDNIDLVENSPCGILLTSTAMASLTDGKVYFGSNHAQWKKLRERNCITDIVCFTEDESKMERDFIFAKQGNTFTSKFCFASTTGKCQVGGFQCDRSTDIFRLVSMLKLQNLCPKYQVLVPE